MIEMKKGQETTQLVDYILLDFNPLFSYDDQLSILVQDLREIINYYQ
jgi:hypothetical protein